MKPRSGMTVRRVPQGTREAGEARVDRASFIRNKRASGRKKDLADLELLGADDSA